eukprot:scaffold87773_cov60-Phaeocystis_antarctica.AAC.1
MVYNSANVVGACRDHASVARANVHLQTRDGGPSFDSSEGESSACPITGETISCQGLDATILNLPEDASSDFVFLERAVVPERWQPTHDRGPASRVGGCIGRQITFFGLSPASHVLSAPCLVPVKLVPSFASPPAVHVMYEYASRVGEGDFFAPPPPRERVAVWTFWLAQRPRRCSGGGPQGCAPDGQAMMGSHHRRLSFTQMVRNAVLAARKDAAPQKVAPSGRVYRGVAWGLMQVNHPVRALFIRLVEWRA